MGRHLGTALRAGLLCLALFGGAGAQTPPAFEEPPGEVRGRVLDAAGAPVAGAAVSLLDRATTSGADGAFRFEGVPRARLTELNVRIVDRTGTPVGCTTLSVPVRFYPLAATLGEGVAVAAASPGDGAMVELTLRPVPRAAIDAFCAACHGTNPCNQTQEYGEGGEKARALGGIAATEDELGGLRERLAQRGADRESFAGLRYRDAHPQALDMARAAAPTESGAPARFRLPPTLRLTDGARVTCDTCHTRHQPTPARRFAVLPFDDNTLCVECHL